MEYKALLERLRTQVRMETNRYGQEILVKDIPDEGNYTGDFDPRVLKVVEEAAMQPKPKTQPTLEEIRARMGWDNLDVTGGAVSGERRILETPDRKIPAAVYGVTPGRQKPCLLFFHGGGFFGGTVECVANPCKALAWYGDMVVVAVDYALAPEHPFPRGLQDCWAAVEYVASHPMEFGVDPAKLGVAGDSAGGNLAAACAQRDRDLGCGYIRFQALLYPVVNVAALPCGSYSWSLGEYEILRHVDYLTQASTVLGKDGPRHIARYLKGEAVLAMDPMVSPIFGKMENLAPALIVNAEYDYLRLEGEAYGRMLNAAGVPAVNLRYRGMDHAFMDKLGLYPQAEDCMREVAERFHRVLESDHSDLCCV